MANKNSLFLLSVLVYSDMFDFPLTKDEIWEHLPAGRHLDYATFLSCLQTSGYWQEKRGYFYLKGRESVIQKREKRALISRQKLKRAQKAAGILSLVPSVRLVALTGSVAARNASENDDIDLLLVTGKNTLWLTRFLALSLLSLNGLRRKKGVKDVKDKVCLNIIMEEDSLAWPLGKRGLYAAWEISQVLPLFERIDAYQKFMSANSWFRDFLPNAKQKKTKNMQAKKDSKFMLFLMKCLGFLNTFLGVLQKQIMRKKITNETISDQFLAFHPVDLSKLLANRFRSKMAILTKDKRLSILPRI